ncbi:MAG: hypothetical protein V9H69_14595 [Anaerolineae bacterium]|jgi:hypothetical protein
MSNQRSQFAASIATSQNMATQPAIRGIAVEDSKEAVLPERSVWAPLGAIALGMAVMFILLPVFGAITTTPFGSLLGASLACAAGLIVISRVHYTRLLGRSFTAVVLFVFVIKIAIGVGHYLYFFEPNYFSQPLGFFPWIEDFGQLEEAMRTISAFWHMYGFGFVDVPRGSAVEKSWFLAVYHALLYYLNSDFFMNFVPWVSFHTLLVGFLVASLALQRGATPRQTTAVFVLASLQPMFLYADLPQRDMVGQFFVVLAVYLVVHSIGKGRQLAFVLPIALILVYEQRWIYPYVIIGGILLLMFLVRRRTGKAIVLLGILLLIWSQASSVILETTIGRYASSSQLLAESLPVTSIDRLPAAFIVGIIGYFPWTQVFEVPDGFIHLPPTFFQAFLGVLIWLIVLPRLWRQWQTTRTVDDLVLFSFLFALTGIVTSATHTGYVHIATVLLLPMACQAPGREWVRKFVVVFYLYLIGHIVFLGLGLGGHNLFIR